MAQLEDRAFLERAWRVTDYGPEAESVPDAVCGGLVRGDFYVLEREGVPSMLITAHLYGQSVAVESLYREGPLLTLRDDLRLLVAFVAARMHEQGAKWVYTTVHKANPLAAKLVTLYTELFGFEEEAIRLMVPLETVRERLQG